VSGHVVVDGSNIATEGRQTPSLAQLEGALDELRRERPDDSVTVVVDATFAHRIDPSEVPHYEELVLGSEIVSPPAGAIGRGDAFLLRIAEKVGGVVLSNDSFQEFHGEHPWLFEQGRLVGATPVPGIGWIFSARQPVRGPRSRVAVRDTRRARDEVVQAIEVATREVVEPDEDARSGNRPRRTRARSGTPTAVNDPMTFISFIAEHRLGSEIEGEVESFTSHGAVVRYGDVRCYAPLSNLADPAPRSAREVLRRGEVRSFVITALDPFRRGIELALPGLGTVTGRPSEETIEAEVRMARQPAVADDEIALDVAAPATLDGDHEAPPARRSRRRVPTTASVAYAPTNVAEPDATPAAIAAAEPAPSAAPRTRRGRARAVTESTSPVLEDVPTPGPASGDGLVHEASAARSTPRRAAPRKAAATSRRPAASAASIATPRADEPRPATTARAATAAKAVTKKTAARKTAASTARPAADRTSPPAAAKTAAKRASATRTAGTRTAVKRAAPAPEPPAVTPPATRRAASPRARITAAAPVPAAGAPPAPADAALATDPGPRRSPRRRTAAAKPGA
jgi:hypothetical protein